MTKRSLSQRLKRAAVVLAMGGSMFQLSGCDPLVRTTLLTGIESTTQTLSSALISALFLSLQNNTTGL